jgi:3-oxoadipate enol-lactonase
MTSMTTRTSEATPDRFWPEAVNAGELFVPTSVGAVYTRRLGSGEPLVLLHSNGHSWHEFAGVIGPLARDFEVFVWDMPGQGWSDPTHSRTSIEGYADVLVEVFDALDISRATVAGCSIGAFIAIALDVRHHDRVAGLGLIEFQFRDRAWWAENWGMIEQSFAVPTQDATDVAARFAGPIGDDVVQRWNIERNLAGSRSLMNVMWAIREYDVAAGLAAMTTPPLVVFGEQGPTIGRREAMEAALPPGATCEVIKGAGHFVTIDQPEAFVRALAALAPDRSAGRAGTSVEN